MTEGKHTHDAHHCSKRLARALQELPLPPASDGCAVNDFQPVNAAEPHQTPTCGILSICHRVCDFRFVSPEAAVDEPSLATGAQCMCRDAPTSLRHRCTPASWKTPSQREAQNAAGCAQRPCDCRLRAASDVKQSVICSTSISSGWCAPDAVHSYAARPIVTFLGALFTGRRGAGVRCAP